MSAIAGRKLRVLDICSGTKSLGKACAAYPGQFEYTSLDRDSRLQPDICTDLHDWEFPARGSYDVIWCSPDCSQYSRCRCDPSFPPRDLERADALVQRCVQLVQHVQPRWVFFENPASSMLVDRGLIDYPLHIVDYCQYGKPYRKSTAIWTNLQGWQPRRCNKTNCWAYRNGRHLSQIGRGTLLSYRNSKGIASVPERLLCEFLELMMREYHSG